jgi:phosphatidylserine/phosphatidylglycerophosphate/cardiolipin synthase-like enzyme
MGQAQREAVTPQKPPVDVEKRKRNQQTIIVAVVVGLGCIQAAYRWLHPAPKPSQVAAAGFASSPGAGQSEPSSGQAAGAIYRVYYGPAIDLERVDTQVLASAIKSIDIAMYSQTDENICAVIAAAARRGVTVRVYRDAREYEHERQRGGGSCTTALVAAGAAVKVRSSGELMHMKSYAVDGYKLRSGSANMSVSGERYQDNDIVLMASSEAAAGFEKEFDQLWNRPDNRTVSATRASSLP